MTLNRLRSFLIFKQKVKLIYTLKIKLKVLIIKKRFSLLISQKKNNVKGSTLRKIFLYYLFSNLKKLIF